MVFDSATKKVKPDPRHGKMQIIREDPAKVFRWSDRETGEADEDMYFFAKQGIFEKVKQSLGRIYILRYYGSDQRHFFWMQEDDTSKDEAICKQVNDLINEEIPEPADDPSEPMEVMDPASDSAPVAPNPTTEQPIQPSSSASAQATRDAQAIATLMQMLAGGMAPRDRSKIIHFIIIM